ANSPGPGVWHAARPARLGGDGGGRDSPRLRALRRPWEHGFRRRSEDLPSNRGRPRLAPMRTVARPGNRVVLTTPPTSNLGGSYRRLPDEVRLIRNTAGEPVSCVGSWSDLTERNQVADPLSQPETQFRDVVEAALQGMGILQDGRIRYANPASARMFGYASPA